MFVPVLINWWAVVVVMTMCYQLVVSCVLVVNVLFVLLSFLLFLWLNTTIHVYVRWRVFEIRNCQFVNFAFLIVYRAYVCVCVCDYYERK